MCTWVLPEPASASSRRPLMSLFDTAGSMSYCGHQSSITAVDQHSRHTSVTIVMASLSTSAAVVLVLAFCGGLVVLGKGTSTTSAGTIY